MVFPLHNFGYRDRSAFADLLGGDLPLRILPPRSCPAHRTSCPAIELDGRVIPDPIPLDRIVAETSADVRDVHQPSTAQRDDGLRADRLGQALGQPGV